MFHNVLTWVTAGQNSSDTRPYLSLHRSHMKCFGCFPLLLSSYFLIDRFLPQSFLILTSHKHLYICILQIR
ncbi:hypothetical protein L1887_18250 [Cichorium endivia]|nr:hypothetical protein L1887_18250 [Cichorium endivia]